MRLRFASPLPFVDLAPSFRRLLFSDALMVLALMVGQVAMPWWIAQEGGAGDLAVYGAALSAVSFAAMPLLSPLGDRYAKRLLIAGALAAFAVAGCALAALATLGHYRLWVLVALQVVPMLALAVITPASASFTAELVPPTQLTRAIGLQQSAQSSGRLIGPAVGGAVLAAGGTGSALWLHAALLGLAAWAALKLPEGGTREGGPRAAGRWWSDLRAGLKANWAIPLERGWIVVNAVSWLFLLPAFTMLVTLKVQSLGLSARWLGGCEAALSLGMLVGAIGGADQWIRRQGRYATRIVAALVQGAALAVVALSDLPWLLLPAFALAGYTNSAMVLVGMTHRMLARPQAFRARMSAGAMMTSQVSATLGPALAGAALLHWPVKVVYCAFAVLGAATSLGLVLVPGFKRFMALGHDEVDGWYERAHPEAFGAAPAE